MRSASPSPAGHLARRVLTTLGVTVTGVVLCASAAAADVAITPAQAEQGGETSVTFLVENRRAGAYTTKVEVDLPPEAPIAEVYPMSVPDWAPRTVVRDVTTPLQGIHGSALSTATSAVIWTRAADAPAAPAVESLRLEMGPLPAVDRLVFGVVQTYSDGTVLRWSGPTSAGKGTVLTLTPAAPGVVPAGGHGHAGDQVAPQQAADGAAAGAAGGPAVLAPPGVAGRSDGSSVDPLAVLAMGVFALGLCGALLLAARGPGRAEEDAEAPETTEGTAGHVPAAREPAPTMELETRDLKDHPSTRELEVEVSGSA